MKTIGFVGLGLMGKEMSKRLFDAGYSLKVWNRNADKLKDLFDSSVEQCSSPRELAEKSDVVITMVTNSAASEEVSCGKNGILEGAHPGLILVDMSSIEPDMSRSIAERAAEKKIAFLDAPVTGNPRVASEGRLGIMVGGLEEVFKECVPIFEKLGVKIVYVGENGTGTTLKLINNIILGDAIMACAEALVLAAKTGINPQKVIDITSVGGARTGAMETRGHRMLSHDFSSHFSANNMYKDLSSGIALAEKYKVTLPSTSISREILRATLAQGNGEMDSCIVITTLEEMANVLVNKEK